MGMKNKVEKMEKQIEFLYSEVSRQKKDLEDCNDLIFFLTKLIVKNKKEEEIETL